MLEEFDYENSADRLPVRRSPFIGAKPIEAYSAGSAHESRQRKEAIVRQLEIQVRNDEEYLHRIWVYRHLAVYATGGCVTVAAFATLAGYWGSVIFGGVSNEFTHAVVATVITALVIACVTLVVGLVANDAGAGLQETANKNRDSLRDKRAWLESVETVMRPT